LFMQGSKTIGYSASRGPSEAPNPAAELREHGLGIPQLRVHIVPFHCTVCGALSVAVPKRAQGIMKTSKHQRWFEAGRSIWPRCGHPCRSGPVVAA
jgi:hypothetical protein